VGLTVGDGGRVGIGVGRSSDRLTALLQATSMTTREPSMRTL